MFGLMGQVYKKVGVPLELLLKYYNACEGLQVDSSMSPEILLFNVLRPFMS